MNTTSVNPTVAWICGTVLLITVLVGLFVLVWHKSIAGTDALGVVGTIVAVGVGALGVHAGVAAGTKSATAGMKAGPPK